MMMGWEVEAVMMGERVRCGARRRRWAMCVVRVFGSGGHCRYLLALGMGSRQAGWHYYYSG